jgi:myo-inositol-1(or 4)-monophosphatase
MPKTDQNMAEITAHAHALADLARPIALQYFRKNIGVENKLQDGFDPVTKADQEIEQAMRAYLTVHRPEDSILGEEWGHHIGTSGLTWVLDPIDGTRGFISGTPTWGVLIALQDENAPLLGLIDQPFTGERFLGTELGATWARAGEKASIEVSKTKSLEQATLLSTFPEIGTESERLAFETVRDRVKLTRYGMDCYGYALLAAGQVDLVIEAGLNAYDIAAPVGLITAAGGMITDWNGGPAHQGGTALAAATPELHAQAMALLRI